MASVLSNDTNSSSTTVVYPVAFSDKRLAQHCTTNRPNLSRVHRCPPAPFITNGHILCSGQKEVFHKGPLNRTHMCESLPIFIAEKAP